MGYLIIFILFIGIAGVVFDSLKNFLITSVVIALIAITVHCIKKFKQKKKESDERTARLWLEKMEKEKQAEADRIKEVMRKREQHMQERLEQEQTSEPKNENEIETNADQIFDLDSIPKYKIELSSQKITNNKISEMPEIPYAIRFCLYYNTRTKYLIYNHIHPNHNNYPSYNTYIC